MEKVRPTDTFEEERREIEREMVKNNDTIEKVVMMMNREIAREEFASKMKRKICPTCGKRFFSRRRFRKHFYNVSTFIDTGEGLKIKCKGIDKEVK
jgi:hypothetical protein